MKYLPNISCIMLMQPERAGEFNAQNGRLEKLFRLFVKLVNGTGGTAVMHGEKGMVQDILISCLYIIPAWNHQYN